MNNKKSKFLPLIAVVPTLPLFIFGIYNVIAGEIEGGMGGGFASLFGLIIALSCILPIVTLFVFMHGVFRHSPPVKRKKSLFISIILHLISFVILFMILSQSAVLASTISTFGIASLIVVCYFTNKAYEASSHSQHIKSSKNMPPKHNTYIPLLAFLPALSFYCIGTASVLYHLSEIIISFITGQQSYLFRPDAINYYSADIFYIASIIPSILLYLCMRQAYGNPPKKNVTLLVLSISAYLLLFSVNMFIPYWHIGIYSVLNILALAFVLYLLLRRYSTISSKRKEK